MGWLEDSVEEFRKLPPAGKLAVGGAAVGVAILAYAQYRSGQASASASTSSNGSTGTTDPGASALTGLGVPSLSSNPADWQSWFSNGLTIPQGGQTASDGAPSTSTTSSASGGASASTSAPAASVATAAAHVVASVTAPAPPPAPKPAAATTVSGSIQNPTAAQTIQHRGTVTPAPRVTFIPTTIRPQPTPGHGRAI